MEFSDKSEKTSDPFSWGKLNLRKWSSFFNFAALLIIVAYIALERESLRFVLDLDGASFGYLAVCNFGLYLVHTYRYFLIINHSTNKISYYDWIEVATTSRLMNEVFAQLGTAYRAFVLKTKFQIDIFQFLADLSFLSWITVVLNLICAIGILSFTTVEFDLLGVSASHFLILMLALIGLAPFVGFFLTQFRKVVASLKYVQWLFTAYCSLYLKILDKMKSFDLMSRITLVSCIGFAINIGVIYFALRCFGIHASLQVLLIFVAVVTTVDLMAPLPGNLGLIEGTFAALGTLLDMSVSQGLLAALAMRVNSYLVVALLGALLFVNRGFSRLWKVK